MRLCTSPHPRCCPQESPHSRAGQKTPSCNAQMTRYADRVRARVPLLPLSRSIGSSLAPPPACFICQSSQPATRLRLGRCATGRSQLRRRLCRDQHGPRCIDQRAPCGDHQRRRHAARANHAAAAHAVAPTHGEERVRTWRAPAPSTRLDAASHAPMLSESIINPTV